MRVRPDFVSMGIIIRAHGVKGDVLVLPNTSDPQLFKSLTTVFIEINGGKRRSYPVERVKFIKNKVLLKLTGIDDRNSALALKGSPVERPFHDNETLSPDEYYIFDLIGLEVRTLDDQYLGTVDDVYTLPANDVYVIKHGSRELLIPAIKDVIKKVDLENEVIWIEPLAGLLM